MRPRAQRFLNILACAPVIATAAVVLAPDARAQNPVPPRPYVVAVDAGHGGSPDNAHPETLFDSGAIGLNGVMEKDLTLDIARRLRQGLEQADMVQVAMTRDDDRYVSVDERSATAANAGASLFVSVHLNSWLDHSVGGSLVLFPGPGSSHFADVMAAALARRLGPLGIASKGTELRDNWWIHATMPVVTVEGAYVTNPQEVALLTTPTFRQQLADAIRSGIEAYDPGIARRRAQIVAWNADHPSAAISVVPSRQPGSARRPSAAGTAFAVALVLVATGLAIRNRRPLAAAGLRLWVAAQEAGAGRPVNRRASRQRRREARRRILQQPQAQAQGLNRPRSVYDELWF